MSPDKLTAPVNGYELEALRRSWLDRLDGFTGSAIDARLARFEAALVALPQPAVMSLGENCAAAIRLRQIGTAHRVSGLFDNIVAPLDSIIAMIASDFHDMLSIRNLRIGEWEDQDSVFDARYGIFYHHYFHLRDAEKDDFSRGPRRRRIDEADIPLFIGGVRSQFEYLVEKFRRLIRADVAKRLLFRRVDGDPVPPPALARLREALIGFGAVRTEIVVVHSRDFAAGEAADRGSHHLIEEHGERWGPIEAWRALA